MNENLTGLHNISDNFDEVLTCNPLCTYNEVLSFEENLPEWRSLTIKLQAHSEYSIRNKDSITNFDKIALVNPATFCHFDPDAGNVKRHKNIELPKTLVCHDMANGYHDDSKVFGTTVYDAYTFYNWAGIDIFCYFSHHLVTIPPLGWINVGHAHGVKVIGTVITEHYGSNLWDIVLETQESWEKFADVLVTIAYTLGFDGWLLNIENKISIPNKLIQFVQYFHEQLHARLTEPLLIWYDSVTVDGHLNWQNALNDKNNVFFEICDGFFTNYSWTEGDIASSVKQAGERRLDLYIGIDVWGRNFYGGGNLNTQEAVKIACSYGCSLAIFAPAWTHEAVPEDILDPLTIYSDNGVPLSRYEQFLIRDRALWGSLWPYLNTRLPTQLPFKSSFCRGQGRRRWMYGEVISPGPWFNLRNMQYQPNSSHGPHGYVLAQAPSPQTSRRESRGILKLTHSDRSEKREGITIQDVEVEVAEEELVKNEVPAIPSTTRIRKPSVTMKIKTALTNVFSKMHSKSKLQRNGTNVEENISTADSAQGPDNSLQSSGKSMVNMSVALALGSTLTKPKVILTKVCDELECLELYLRDAFIGGSCLKVNCSDEVADTHRTIRVFQCDFFCEESLIVCVVTKKLRYHEEQFLNIKLLATEKPDKEFAVVLVGHEAPQNKVKEKKKEVEGEDYLATLFVYPLVAASPQFESTQKYLLTEESGFYIPTGNAFGWTVRYYEVKLAGVRITSINCTTGLVSGPILLGHLGLCQRKPAKRVSTASSK